MFAWVNDESGNGLAGGGVVCATGEKAQGATMRKTPLGDRFDIDLVLMRLDINLEQIILRMEIVTD